MKYSDIPPLFLLLFHIGKHMILLWNSNQWLGGRSEESKVLEYFQSFKICIMLLLF